MTMAKRDAADTQLLLAHLRGRALPDGTAADSRRALDASVRLADRTSTVLGHGLTGDDLRASWNDTQILLDLLRGNPEPLRRCSDVELGLVAQAVAAVDKALHGEERYRAQVTAIEVTQQGSST